MKTKRDDYRRRPVVKVEKREVEMKLTLHMLLIIRESRLRDKGIIFRE